MPQLAFSADAAADGDLAITTNGVTTVFECPPWAHVFSAKDFSGKGRCELGGTV